MQSGIVGLLTAALIAAHGATACAQRAATARVAVATPIAARQQPFLPTVSATSSSPIPRWPFVLVGAAAGAAIATRSVVRSERATGGDDFFPQLGLVVIGGGTLLGAVGGFVVGSILHEATK